MYEKYTDKTIHICVLTHFSLCVFNLMLPACRPNFSEVIFAAYKAEQAWCRDSTVMLMFRGYLFASGLDYLQCWQAFFSEYFLIYRNKLKTSLF
jgi:hypothetical protein